jgi:hypothetical protein
MGSGQFATDAFAAAWFWAIGAHGFGDIGTAMAGTDSESLGGSMPNVIISVSLDDLDGPCGDMLP